MEEKREEEKKRHYFSVQHKLQVLRYGSKGVVKEKETKSHSFLKHLQGYDPF